MAQSPSVIIRERDESSYATTTSNTVLAVVGYATKGPIGQPVELISRNNFLETFGPPPKNAPWSSLAVYRAFNRTNQVIFYRVANDDAAAAEYVILNDRDASSGYQEFSQDEAVAYGNYTTQEVHDFQLSVNGGTTRDVYIVSPSTGDWELSDIATQINTQITSDTSGFQEFETTSDPSVSRQNEEYRFQGSVDGANLQTTGSGSNDFSVFLNPGDSLSEVATAIDDAISAGTHGYHAWNRNSSIDPDTQTNLSPSTDYDFNVDVNGAGTQDITITTLSTAPTWREVAELMQDAINSAFPSNNAYVRVLSAGYIYVESQDTGTGSTVALADDLQGGGGNPLFDNLDSGGTFDSAVDGGAGTGSGYSVAINSDTGRIRITSNTTGTSSTVSITAPGFGNDLGNIVGSVLEANDGEASVPASAAVNSDSGQVRISTDATGSGSTVSITAGTGTDNEDLVALLGTDSAVEGQDAILAENTDNIQFKAKDKGSATNNIAVTKSSSTNPVNNNTIHTVEVSYDGNVVETFSDVSLDTTSDNFFVTKMNADPSNGGSEWVTVDYEDNDGNDTVEFPDGEYTLGSGTDAWQQGDALGDYDYRAGDDGIPTSGGSTLFTSALASDSDLANEELYDYHILLTPDNNAQATQDAAISLAAANRKDFFYVADPPMGLTYREVVDWHNGTGSLGRGNALNTSYAATYWSWMKDYNPVAGEYVWSPPSVWMGEKYIEVDNRFGPWYAPAGDVRGKLLGVADIEKSPSKPQRDYLYGDLNAVNPIVKFAAKGIEIYGQKTLLRDNSALNRINVRRMVIYAKKLIRSAMQGLIFEQNTPDTWARATNFINAILEPIRQRNGLEDYQVLINESTNENVTDPTKMKGIIKLVPIAAVETIDLTITLLNPGAEISE